MLRARRRGLSLIEVMVGTLLMSMTVITAATIFPVINVLKVNSGYQSRAASIAQRKLEQLRRLSAEQLTYSSLRTAGVIDEGNTTPYVFTTTDALTADLPDAVGTLRVTNLGSTIPTDLVEVTVTLTWTGARNRPGRLVTTSYIASKKARRL